MRLLYLTSTRIGDAVLSTGLLSHLIETNPGIRVTVACGPAACPLFEAVPGLDRILRITKSKFGGHWLGLWRKVVLSRWDIVVDLRGSALSWLLATRRRIVFRGGAGPYHRVAQIAKAARLAPPPPPRLWVAPRHEQEAEHLVGSAGPFLALGPTANWRGKEWPIDRFITLVERLTAPSGIFKGARIVVFGGPGEEKAAAPLLNALASERRIDLVGRIDLLTAFACLKRAAMFVGNDSGLMHIAAASGCPTLGLFGPSRDVHYAPFGAKCASVRTPETFDELIGRPGYDHRTTGSLMTGLAVETVEGAAVSLWNRVQKAAA